MSTYSSSHSLPSPKRSLAVDVHNFSEAQEQGDYQNGLVPSTCYLLPNAFLLYSSLLPPGHERTSLSVLVQDTVQLLQRLGTVFVAPEALDEGVLELLLGDARAPALLEQRPHALHGERLEE